MSPTVATMNSQDTKQYFSTKKYPINTFCPDCNDIFSCAVDVVH